MKTRSNKSILQRNPNVEILRVIMMLSIIMLHYSGEIFPQEGDFGYVVGRIIRSYFFLGVFTFAFISGYYGIKWNHRKWLHYEFMAIEWGGAVLLVNYLLSGICLQNVYMFLLPITSQVCWYFSAYMLLMVFSPFLNYGIDNIPIKKYKYLLIIMMIVCYGGNFLYHRASTSFMLLLFIYMLGRYINKSKQEIASIKAFAIFLCSSTLLVFVIGAAAHYRGEEVVYKICNNHNPLLIITSVSLFFAFKNSRQVECKLSRLCVSLSSCLFAVYVVHVLVLHSEWPIFYPLSSLNPYIHLVILSIASLFIISLLELLRRMITNKFEISLIQFLESNI